MVVTVDNELEARKRLGLLVRQARRSAGYANTQTWAAKVGRSDRQLLGLERVEKVGTDTYAAVAEALGWPVDRIPEILAGRGPSSASTALADVSDDDLVEELRRRLRAGGEHEQRSAPMTAPRARYAGSAGGAGDVRARLEQHLRGARTDEEREQLERMLADLDAIEEAVPDRPAETG